MKTLINKILKLGIESHIQANQAKRIRILNGVSAIIGIVLLLTSILIYLLMRPYEETNITLVLQFLYGKTELFEKGKILFPVIDLLGAFFCGLILIFNRYKKYNTAIFLLWFSALIFVSYFYWAAGVRVVFFYFVPASIPIIFYKQQKKYITLWGMTLVTVFVFSFLKKHNIEMNVNSPIANHKLIIYLINFTSVYVIIFLTILHFKTENQKNEKKLSYKNDLLYQQADRISKQHESIAKQKSEIENKNRNLTDSINYAQKIQSAIFPNKEILHNHFSESFILFKPKDIVSGDFYYFKQSSDFLFVAAADCTGHGVPGAFMTILGINLLNDIIKKDGNKKPSDVLEELRSGIKAALIQEDPKSGAQDLKEIYINASVKDGIDMSLCLFDFKNQIMDYSGANNPAIIIRNNELIETSPNQNPIGIYYNELPFTDQPFKLQKNDTIYLFSDGYYDQFGGKNGRKLYYRNFKDILLQINDKPLAEQKKILLDTIESWQGEFDQLDDILIIGLKI